MDTIRLLARQTDNLVDELWMYIKENRPVETTVLLLAAQGQIRGSGSSKRSVNGNQNGFEVIMDRIVLEHYEHVQPEEMATFKCTYLLVRIISRAGEVLDAYIQQHSEVRQFVYCSYSVTLPLVSSLVPFTKSISNHT